MLVLPKSLRIVRSEKQEQKLVEQTRAWLKTTTVIPAFTPLICFGPAQGVPGSAASRRTEHAHGGALLRRKVLHAFFLSALNGGRA